MLNEYTTELARQGLGYFLFVGSLIVIGLLYKKVNDLQNEKVDLANKRVEDLKDARNAYAVIAETQSKTQENTLTIVQNIQQLLNNLKR